MGSAGSLTIEADLRKHAGLRLLTAGRTADEEVQLERALDFHRMVDASHARGDRGALAEAQRDSA